MGGFSPAPPPLARGGGPTGRTAGPGRRALLSPPRRLYMPRLFNPSLRRRLAPRPGVLAFVHDVSLRPSRRRGPRGVDRHADPVRAVHRDLRHHVFPDPAAAAAARQGTEALVQGARRGDTVVTSGGLIGKVTKSTDDTEVELEIAPNVRVRLARSGIADVRSKGEPVKSDRRKTRRPRRTPARLTRAARGAEEARSNVPSRPLEGRLDPGAGVLRGAARRAELPAAEAVVAAMESRLPSFLPFRADRARPRPAGRRAYPDGGRQRFGDQDAGRLAARRRARQDARGQDLDQRRHRRAAARRGGAHRRPGRARPRAGALAARSISASAAR